MTTDSKTIQTDIRSDSAELRFSCRCLDVGDSEERGVRDRSDTKSNKVECHHSNLKGHEINLYFNALHIKQGDVFRRCLVVHTVTQATGGLV